MQRRSDANCHEQEGQRRYMNNNNNNSNKSQNNNYNTSTSNEGAVATMPIPPVSSVIVPSNINPPNTSYAMFANSEQMSFFVFTVVVVVVVKHLIQLEWCALTRIQHVLMVRTAAARTSVRSRPAQLIRPRQLSTNLSLCPTSATTITATAAAAATANRELSVAEQTLGVHGDWRGAQSSPKVQQQLTAVVLGRRQIFEQQTHSRATRQSRRRGAAARSRLSFPFVQLQFARARAPRGQHVSVQARASVASRLASAQTQAPQRDQANTR